MGRRGYLCSCLASDMLGRVRGSAERRKGWNVDIYNNDGEGEGDKARYINTEKRL